VTWNQVFKIKRRAVEAGVHQRRWMIPGADGRGFLLMFPELLLREFFVVDPLSASYGWAMVPGAEEERPCLHFRNIIADYER